MKLPEIPFLQNLAQTPEERVLRKARDLSTQGKLEKAVTLLESTLKRAPENEPLLFEAALHLLLVSRKTDAGECLKKILTRNPRRIDSVLEFVEGVKMRLTDVGPFHDAIAEHYLRQKDHPKALDIMSRIPADELRVYLGRHSARWEAAKKNRLRQSLTESQLRSAYYLSLALECQGDYPAAAQAYREIFRTNPEEGPRVCDRLKAVATRDYHNLSLRLALADLLLELGRGAEGLTHLEQTLNQDSKASAPGVVERLNRFLESNPEEPAALWLLLRAYREGRSYREMIEVIDRLREQNAYQQEIIQCLSGMTRELEDHPELRVALADTYLAIGKPALAVEAILHGSDKMGPEEMRAAMKKVIQACPDHPRALVLLGDLDLRAGETERGVERLKRALELAPEEGPVLFTKLLSLLEQGIARGPLAACLSQIAMRDQDWNRMAVLLRYRLRHQPEDAGVGTQMARKALEAEPSHPGLQLALGEGLVILEQPEAAISALADFLSVHPDRAGEALHTLSAVARLSPQAARLAIPVFRGLVENKILLEAAYFGVGESALLAGEAEESVQAFLELSRLAPHRMNDLRNTLESLLQQHPDAGGIRYLLARTYLENADFKSAASELRKIPQHQEEQLAPLVSRWEEALAKSPEDMNLRVGLSTALLCSKNFQRVRALAAETLRLQDDEITAPIHLDLGDTCLEAGDIGNAIKRYFKAYRINAALAPDAVARLQRLLQLHPNSPLASLALGKILCAEGKLAEGLSHLLEAYRNQPQLAEIVLAELDGVATAHPKSAEVLSCRIQVLSALGRDRESASAIRTLLESHPDSAKSSIPALEAILVRHPDLAEAHLTLALAHSRQNEVVAAARACGEAYRVDPTQAPRVIRMCAELTEQHPQVAAPYITMAEVFLKDGEVPAAAEKLYQAAARTDASQGEVLGLLDEILDQDAGTARVAFLAADILSRFGRNATAISAYQKCLDQDPEMLDPVLTGYDLVLEKDSSLGEAYLARARARSLRQDFDGTVEDLAAAVRLSPPLAHEVLNEARRLQPRLPDHYELVLLHCDLLLTVGNLEGSVELLENSINGPWEKAQKFELLLRHWRALGAQGKGKEARQVLQELEATTEDRDDLLERIHRGVLSQIHFEVQCLRGLAEEKDASKDELSGLATRLMSLGELEEARGVLHRNSEMLEKEELLNIHSKAAVLASDYFRAAELLKPLGPSRRLAFALARSGDHLLACRTLEQLSAEDMDPDLQTALQLAYRKLVLGELSPKGERLVGETVIHFGEQN